MGFYVHLLIVHPHKVKVRERPVSSRPDKEDLSKEYTLWKIEGILAVGRVTRLEKLTAKHFAHIHNSFPSQQRAGICLVDSIFPKLTGPLSQPKKSLFAPRFTVDKGADMDPYSWREKNLTFAKLQGGE